MGKNSGKSSKSDILTSDDRPPQKEKHRHKRKARDFVADEERKAKRNSLHASFSDGHELSKQTGTKKKRKLKAHDELGFVSKTESEISHLGKLQKTLHQQHEVPDDSQDNLPDESAEEPKIAKRRKKRSKVLCEGPGKQVIERVEEKQRGVPLKAEQAESGAMNFGDGRFREGSHGQVKQKKKKRVSFCDQDDGLDGNRRKTLSTNESDSRVERSSKAGHGKADHSLDGNRWEPLSINEGDGSVDADTLDDRDKYVWGKRFTKEEDEILQDAIHDYIKERGWNQMEGLGFILNCSKHKEARHCWKDIRRCLPHRPQKAIFRRAHVLLEEGTHLGRWSNEESGALKRLQEEYGHNWRKISALLGRGRTNIKEKWRTLKRQKATGSWTQAELQNLCDMVYKCLRAKATLGNMPNKNDHRILRHDINWEKIANDMGTHGHGACCAEWYYTLASSMIASGDWADGDDFLLLQRLLECGACEEEEVEWDQLLDHRSGQLCLTRWKQMMKHLGENRSRQFLEKLDLLVHRYAPELLETPLEDGVLQEKLGDGV